MSNTSRAVVTSIFGEYDDLQQIYSPYDTFCFTDCEEYTNGERILGWNIIRQKTEQDMHPRLQAKMHKLGLHHYLPDYDQFLWIDGSVKMNNAEAVIDLFHPLNHDVDLGLFEHPVRDCIYDEAMISLTMEKYYNVGIEQQIDFYRKASYPEHAGLWASGVFVRNVNKETNELFNIWWSHNKLYSYQDQLSLAIILNYLKPKVIMYAHSIWDNPWFTIAPHKGGNK